MKPNITDSHLDRTVRTLAGLTADSQLSTESTKTENGFSNPFIEQPDSQPHAETQSAQRMDTVSSVAICVGNLWLKMAVSAVGCVAVSCATAVGGLVPFVAKLAVFFALISTASATTYYVKETGNNSSAGTTWATALASVGTAITKAASGDEIWIATGTYKQLAALTMKNGVGIYGRFALYTIA